ncbi:hypothetical protein F511_40720 [Dorcoceras hygrometricum]|uniref:Uncharacterized protein n=1 Tax=Dorcoceras hygrometricum TaxID=472368 RepID=A0A2Z7A5P7_9LAMI|nr:hypothetical protein F511_40720 [Dorcoceras hygrometricum]
MICAMACLRLRPAHAHGSLLAQRAAHYVDEQRTTSGQHAQLHRAKDCGRLRDARARQRQRSIGDQARHRAAINQDHRAIVRPSRADVGAAARGGGRLSGEYFDSIFNLKFQD